MILSVLATVLVVVCSSFALSLWRVLFLYTPVALRIDDQDARGSTKCGQHERQQMGGSSRGRRRGPLRIGVVLGSGGHTSEMLRTLAALPRAYWADNRPAFIVSATDAHSAAAAQEQEQRLFRRNAIVWVIPRAREVGQAYASSVLSTLRALRTSLAIVAAEAPEVLLVNGPGVCVPVVAAGLLLAAVLPWRFHRPAVVYLESFTCVRHLSLTGRLLAPFIADTFTVSWRPLLPVVRQLRWRRRGAGGGGGGVVYIGTGEEEEGQEGQEGQEGGRRRDGDALASPTATTTTATAPSTRSSDCNGEAAGDRVKGEYSGSGTAAAAAAVSDLSAAGPYALVTVGSTRFDELVSSVATEAVCATLKATFGITRLLIQYGTSDFTLNIPGSVAATVPAAADGHDQQQQRQECVCAGVTVEAFRYRPVLSRWVSSARLVVTHAGAGTILECLQARVPTVVVPNRRLMSDHQLQLAEALAAGRFLFCLSPPEGIAAALPGLGIDSLRPHEGVDRRALRRALALPLTGKADEECGE